MGFLKMFHPVRVGRIEGQEIAGVTLVYALLREAL